MMAVVVVGAGSGAGAAQLIIRIAVIPIRLLTAGTI